MNDGSARLYTSSEMSRADGNAQELGIPGGVLMERAGAGMAREILARFGGERPNVLVLAGGGNNGGDGFVIARELHRAGHEVRVAATKRDLSGDPKVNLDAVLNLGVPVHDPESLKELLEGTDLIVDALLGTGFSGEVREREAALIRTLNDAGAATVSVDIPSGVDGSTGEVHGEAVRADLTLCAHAVKVGCAVSPGKDHAGEVVTVGIGLPEEAERDIEPALVLTDARSLRGSIPRLSGESHKYSAGAVLVLAGSRTVTGASVLSVEGAQRAGCGIVFLAVPESVAPALDLRLTEALIYGLPEDGEGHPAPEALEVVLEKAGRASAVVAGPGIGIGDAQRRLLEGLLRLVELPVLLDADALTNLAGTDAVARRSAPTVLTPHAGELGRLLGVGAGEVTAHRLRSATEAAERNGCTVLLKGGDTLVAQGGRPTSVNTSGTVALATAGTGDVLSGVIGALLSRGMDPYEAARAGAWAHGRAAGLWLDATGWPAESLIATDLLDWLPRAIGELL
ncbi:YjeF family C-terminal domain [Rubrobacter radiotolerans]|uniref:Bifunctional NAD(P)H-hydrate repair enzyme n=1 Tax=Rubrobacter radiotolerans TaxID=42256 RepID=A0A023X0G0_RUBRA|nr:bifunctional ADP-dependent NAD(P)H-hydrate dehydratase/NAD(P)H-hydrate epimerase [Rubrobacter radiotolerans]AHY45962.1 YjeF family C-terminal domain [Rubrobacter radiotolerans]MDX5893375.1 bifunctional ADP-dependent NAD(P)H-hydrate dehydratase/NAD(P)H-hydrate epimerase [Rubrobacter radiotolerans]SMC03598.1 NAD(P)H-hydrate epimerase [Rubrobacter radiotolerans DSM 5868]